MHITIYVRGVRELCSIVSDSVTANQLNNTYFYTIFRGFLTHINSFTPDIKGSLYTYHIYALIHIYIQNTIDVGIRTLFLIDYIIKP